MFVGGGGGGGGGVIWSVGDGGGGAGVTTTVTICGPDVVATVAVITVGVLSSCGVGVVPG